MTLRDLLPDLPGDEAQVRAGHARIRARNMRDKIELRHNYGGHTFKRDPRCEGCRISAKADINEAVGRMTEGLCRIWSQPSLPRGFL